MTKLQSFWQAFQQSPHFWDIIMLVCILISVVGFLTLLVIILGLPGRIAVARNHPDAEAVYLMGWIGFMAIVPWIQALIWAFKPTDKVDIRYFPEQEQAEERKALERLSAYAYGRSPPASEAAPSVPTKAETLAASSATSKPTE